MIRITIGRRNLPRLECLETDVTSLLRHSRICVQKGWIYIRVCRFSVCIRSKAYERVDRQTFKLCIRWHDNRVVTGLWCKTEGTYSLSRGVQVNKMMINGSMLLHL